jgi:hypothetical protein
VRTPPERKLSAWPAAACARDLRDLIPQAPDIPVVSFLAKLPPLPPGDHQVVDAIEMSARHCSGLPLGTGPKDCLDAGTTKLFKCTFTVVPWPLPASRR